MPNTSEHVMKDPLTTEHEVISPGVDLIEGAQKSLGFLRAHAAAVASNSTANILDPEMESYGYAPLCAYLPGNETIAPPVSLPR